MRRFQQALIVRIIGLFIVIAAVIAALSGAVRATRQSVYAQATEPTTVIDAVFRDLSTRLGQSLTRQNVQLYSGNRARLSSQYYDTYNEHQLRLPHEARWQPDRIMRVRYPGDIGGGRYRNAGAVRCTHTNSASDLTDGARGVAN